MSFCAKPVRKALPTQDNCSVDNDPARTEKAIIWPILARSDTGLETFSARSPSAPHYQKDYAGNNDDNSYHGEPIHLHGENILLGVLGRTAGLYTLPSEGARKRFRKTFSSFSQSVMANDGIESFYERIIFLHYQVEIVCLGLAGDDAAVLDTSNSFLVRARQRLEWCLRDTSGR
jgi:hypothetical protein